MTVRTQTDQLQKSHILLSLQQAHLTPTGYTLDDIYNLIHNNATTTETSHNLSTSTSPTPSMHTTTEIYTALASLINPGTVREGTVYLGQTGTYTPPYQIPTDGLIAHYTFDEEPEQP